MSDDSPKQNLTRRRFLVATAVPLSAFLTHGCGSLPFGRGKTGEGYLTESMPESAHPLAGLSFSTEGRVNRFMSIERLEAPAHTVEGYDDWRVKGTHPYPFLTRSTAEAIDLAGLTSSEPRSKQAPPLGIRSAVPLGGFGAGSLELRADGSLADWQIFNNSPAGGGGKIHLDHAFFGLRVRPSGGTPRAWTVRTHPPDDLPPLESLAYSGGFPVSRLQLADPELPLRASLYAYSDFDLHDATAAATPAVIFSLIFSNPTSEALETSIMFNLPNHIEGTFRTERGFILSRSGSDPASGEISLSFASALNFSSAVASDLNQIWEAFEKNGDFSGLPGLGLFEYGAVTTRFIIEAGATRTVSLILAWHFPHRPFAGAIIGNAYANRFASASDAGAETNRKLTQIWRSLLSWDALCTENTLPRTVQDALRNSLGQLYKTTFCTAGGRWRSWDCFATAELTSLRHLLYRALPLMLFHPTVLQSHLRAFASRQEPDGRFNHSLGEGDRFPMDHAVASSEAGTIPIFILSTYLYFRANGDEAFLKEIWPYIVKSLSWQLAITTPDGLPSNLPALGDWTSYSEEGVDLSDTLLHVGALSAVQKMSETIGETGGVGDMSRLIASGVQSIERYFWAGTHFRARWTAYKPLSDAGDDRSLLAFVWLYMLGIDGIVDGDALRQHLDFIEDRNAPPVDPKSSDSQNPLFRPAAALCWSALHIMAGSPSRGLSTAGATIEYLENVLRDPWGQYEEINLEYGLPWSNPHHVSHLSVWFLLAALSGQQYDAAAKTLLLSPKIDNRSRIPFFTPGAHGLLTVQRMGRYQIQVLSGRLELVELLIGEEIRYRDIYLETGETLEIRR